MKFIDKITYKSLHIKDILDLIHPYSALGAKQKKCFLPYTTGNEEKLNNEFQEIAELSNIFKEDDSFHLKLTSLLSKFNDITNLVNELSYEPSKYHSQVLEIDELYDIKKFVFYYEETRLLIEEKNIDIVVACPSLSSLLNILDPNDFQIPSFSITNGFSQKLSTLKSKLTRLNNSYTKLECSRLNKAKEELGLKNIEKEIVISRNNKDLLDKLLKSTYYITTSENFANITFTLRQSESMVNLKKKGIQLKDEIKTEELLVRNELTKTVTNYKRELLTSLSLIAKLDYLTARAVFQNKFNCCIPKIMSQDNNKIQFSFNKAINLKIKTYLQLQNINYQPIDFTAYKRISAITGANMAGKTTLLETIGQLVYLTCMAIPLPCEDAVVSLVDFIFCSQLPNENYRSDLSSFAAELISLNEVIINNHGKGLFLVDEFARGTNPVEGEAFSVALINFFVESKTRNVYKDMVVTATHFPSANITDQANHYKIAGISHQDYIKLKQSLKFDKFTDRDKLSQRIFELHKYMNYQPELLNASNIPPQDAVIIAEILGVDQEIIAETRSLIKKKRKTNSNYN